MQIATSPIVPKIWGEGFPNSIPHTTWWSLQLTLLIWNRQAKAKHQHCLIHITGIHSQLKDNHDDQTRQGRSLRPQKPARLLPGLSQWVGGAQAKRVGTQWNTNRTHQSVSIDINQHQSISITTLYKIYKLTKATPSMWSSMSSACPSFCSPHTCCWPTSRWYHFFLKSVLLCPQTLGCSASSIGVWFQPSTWTTCTSGWTLPLDCWPPPFCCPLAPTSPTHLGPWVWLGQYVGRHPVCVLLAGPVLRTRRPREASPRTAGQSATSSGSGTLLCAVWDCLVPGIPTGRSQRRGRDHC